MKLPRDQGIEKHSREWEIENRCWGMGKWESFPSDGDLGIGPLQKMSFVPFRKTSLVALRPNFPPSNTECSLFEDWADAPSPCGLGPYPPEILLPTSHLDPWWIHPGGGSARSGGDKGPVSGFPSSPAIIRDGTAPNSSCHLLSLCPAAPAPSGACLGCSTESQ